MIGDEVDKDDLALEFEALFRDDPADFTYTTTSGELPRLLRRLVVVATELEVPFVAEEARLLTAFAGVDALLLLPVL